MLIENDQFIIFAVSPNSWGAKRTVSEAVKHARININWKGIEPDQKDVNISVYICHPETQVDANNGGLLFPPNQKPIFIDNVKTNRPTQGKKK